MNAVPTTLDAYRLLHDGSLMLAQVEANGIRVDTERLSRSIKEAEAKAERIEAELKGDKVWRMWERKFGSGSKLRSNEQLAYVVYEKLGYPCSAKTASGDPSASEKALQDVDHPFVKRLFKARHLRQAVGTFLKGILRETTDSYLHPSFNLNTAVSFRSSSSDPNFQNFPRRDESIASLVRSCFIPRRRTWHFWEIDFKGIEVAVNAAINRDPVLLEYVRTDPGRMHKDAAADLFLLRPEDVTKPVRDRAKNQFVFASFYGSYYCQTARGLWEDVCRNKKLTAGEGGPWLKDWLEGKGIKELGDCDPKRQPRDGTFEKHVQEVERKLWERFRVYKRWRDDWWEAYKKKGWFDTPTGFRVHWGQGGVLGRNDSISYPAQGSAFHCLLWTLIRLQKWLKKNKMRTRIVGQIHDSGEGDSPPNELDAVFDKAQEIVSVDLPKHWPWIIVPMQIEIEVAEAGESWFRKRKWIRGRNGKWGPEAA